MMINLKDNSEKDKYILELFQTSPKEAFRLLFDAYHMKLCIYAVQLTEGQRNNLRDLIFKHII